MEHDFSPNPNSPHHKEDKKSLFLNKFPKHGTILKTSQVVNVHRSTINRWLKEDLKFREAYLEIENEITETLEESAMKRALDGSETLTIFLLKSRRPSVYRDNPNYVLSKKMSEYCDYLISSVIGVLKKNLPDYCPSCRTALNSRNRIAAELHALAQKSSGPS